MRTLLIGLLLATLLHGWIAHATVWEVINSNLQFLVWPGLAAVLALQNLLPQTLTVQYDPLPHPIVMWAALLVNFVAWAALFCAVVAGIKAWRRRARPWAKQ